MRPDSIVSGSNAAAAVISTPAHELELSATSCHSPEHGAADGVSQRRRGRADRPGGVNHVPKDLRRGDDVGTTVVL